MKKKKNVKENDRLTENSEFKRRVCTEIKMTKDLEDILRDVFSKMPKHIKKRFLDGDFNHQNIQE